MATAKALDDVTGEIVDAAYNLHTGLGPGLLESDYETGGASTSNDRSRFRSTIRVCISTTVGAWICRSSPA